MRLINLIPLILLTSAKAQVYNTAESYTIPLLPELQVKEQPRPKAEVEESSDDSSYLLNPKDKRFWKEGNHVPDEGLLNLLTQPNEENAERWLLRMEIKNRELKRVQQIVEAVQLKLINAGKLPDHFNEKEALEMLLSSPKREKVFERVAKFDKDFQIYFLFDPNCRACHEQAEVYKGKPGVTPIQVSEGDLVNLDGLKKSVRPSSKFLKRVKEDLLSLGVNSKTIPTPVSIVMNKKTKLYEVLVGKKDQDEIQKVSKNLIK